MIPQKIAKEIQNIIRSLRAKFENKFLALILYGSWANERAREDSDIDLLAIFRRIDEDITKRVNKISSDVEVRYERAVTLLPGFHSLKAPSRGRTCYEGSGLFW